MIALAGLLAVADELDALTGVERHRLDLAGHINARAGHVIAGEALVADGRFGSGDDVAFPGSLAGRWAALCLPGTQGAVAQHTVWSVPPAVEHPREKGVGAAGLHQKLLIGRVHAGFGGGEEARAQPHACCSEREGRSQTSSVADAARKHDRDRSDGITDGRDQRHRGDLGPNMTPCLPRLCNDDVGT